METPITLLKKLFWERDRLLRRRRIVHKEDYLDGDLADRRIEVGWCGLGHIEALSACLEDEEIRERVSGMYLHVGFPSLSDAVAAQTLKIRQATNTLDG